jgi:hypothetical protein
MPLSAYALVSLAELKDFIGAGGNAKDSTLEDVINRVSDEVEAFLDRQVVTRGALTEYHTLRTSGAPVETNELWTLERPIITVTTVHEDTGYPRTYGAAYLLAEGTGYEVIKPKGLIRWISSLGMPWDWSTGHRAIKVIYSGGYANTAGVPTRIKAVVLRYAALIWSEQKRGDFGISGAADSLGNYTRFLAAQMTDDMKAALEPERRWGFWESGERDS